MSRVLQAGKWNFEKAQKCGKMTCLGLKMIIFGYFSTFLASFKISISSLQHPSHVPVKAGRMVEGLYYLWTLCSNHWSIGQTVGRRPVLRGQRQTFSFVLPPFPWSSPPWRINLDWLFFSSFQNKNATRRHTPVQCQDCSISVAHSPFCYYRRLEGVKWPWVRTLPLCEVRQCWLDMCRSCTHRLDCILHFDIFETWPKN